MNAIKTRTTCLPALQLTLLNFVLFTLWRKKTAYFSRKYVCSMINGREEKRRGSVVVNNCNGRWCNWTSRKREDEGFNCKVISLGFLGLTRGLYLFHTLLKLYYSGIFILADVFNWWSDQTSEIDSYRTIVKVSTRKLLY